MKGLAVLFIHLSVSSACAECVLPLSAMDLSRRLMSRDQKLQALVLVYEEIPRGGPGRPPGGYSRRVIAAQAPNKFMRDNGHGRPGMHWKDDPQRKCVYITPDRVLTFSTLNRIIDEGTPVAAGSVPLEPTDELIFHALCWWPFTEWPQPEVQGRKWSMYSLMSSGNYSLRRAFETVQGRACYVLEVPGVDVLWVDSQRPDCVVRRDVFNIETGGLLARFEFGDYQKYVNGVWLPGSFRSIQFDSYAHTESLRERRVIDTRFLVSYNSVNEQVDDSVFNLDPPPGTVRRVSEGKTDRFELVRDGEDAHADTIAEWAKRLALTAHGSRLLRLCFQCSVAFMLGVGASWVLLPWMSRIKPHQQNSRRNSGSGKRAKL